MARHTSLGQVEMLFTLHVVVGSRIVCGHSASPGVHVKNTGHVGVLKTAQGQGEITRVLD